jgi:hypothetical protein
MNKDYASSSTSSASSEVSAGREALQAAMQSAWGRDPILPGEKARQYVDQFFSRKLLVNKISGKVEGNHGTYSVTIELKANNRLSSACSCYIGKGGGCHHCLALGYTFLQAPQSFEVIAVKRLEAVKTTEDLQVFLKEVTLDSLLEDLKANGISQKQLAETVGISPRQLSLIKAGEARNRFYNELGPLKLSCLWMLEHFKEKSGK